MENSSKQLNSDLQKFIEKFQPNKYKILPKGIEIRGITEIHSHISEAKALIEKLKLKLTVAHNAEMVSYGAFEVKTSD
ncbi:MAG: hypothetical protein ACQUHE_11440 [Bacteroidia bacterium]